MEAHRGASGSSQKRIKKEIDLQCKDLESLKGHISHEESYLQEDMPEQDIPESNDPLNQGAEAVMPPNSGANDTPSGSAVAPVSGSSSGEDAAMEVDKGAVSLPPTSPVSREDDDLLDENEVVKVEAGLAHLTVSSPSGQVRRVRAPPLLRHLPLWKAKRFNCRSCRPLSHGLQRRSCTDDPLEEASDVQKTGSQPPVKTLE